MSDNRRVYRTILTKLRQLYPKNAKGRTIQHLNTLAGLVSGIVQGKSCQFPTIARKVPGIAKPESRIKQYSRWTQNGQIDQSGYYLPYIEVLLNSANRDNSNLIDGCLKCSFVGFGWLAQSAHLAYELHRRSADFFICGGRLKVE